MSETEAKRVFWVNVEGCLGAVAPSTDEAVEVADDNGVCAGFKQGCDPCVVPLVVLLWLLSLLMMMKSLVGVVRGMELSRVCEGWSGQGGSRERGRHGGRSGSWDHDGMECSME